MSSAEEKLRRAARWGRVGEVLSLLRDNAGLDVNLGNGDGDTALQYASYNGHAELSNSFCHTLPSMSIARPEVDTLTFHKFVGMAKCLLFNCC